MSKYLYIIVTLLLLLGLGIWWLRQTLPPPEQSEVASPTASKSSVNLSKPKSASISSVEELVKTPEKKRERYIEKARSYGMSLNRPANFYGQILDQNNEPVVGVKVKCELSYFGAKVLPGLMPSNKQFERISDKDGRFSVQNEAGLAMDVKLPSMEDCEFKPTALQVMLRDEGAGKPAPALSTSEKPYIFRAFKRGQSEFLIKGAIAFYHCIPDGRSYVVNLKDNRVAEDIANGELIISIRRPPGTMAQGDYDWSVQIEGMKVDIVESRDLFMYLAPASGYQPSWGFAQQAGVQNYTREVNPKFYIKSRDGSSYGRLEFMIISDYRDKSAIIINYALNPSGSRNLQ